MNRLSKEGPPEDTGRTIKKNPESDRNAKDNPPAEVSKNARKDSAGAGETGDGPTPVTGR